MHRLIIIGNGFDLAHGSKTSYHDFIMDYIKECLLKAFDKVVNPNSTTNKFCYFKDELIELKISKAKTKEIYVEALNKINTIKEFKALLNKMNVTINFEFKMLKAGIEKLNEYNWVDFEIEYFDELIRIRNMRYSTPNQAAVQKSKMEEIKKLNEQFEIFKFKLETYLSKQQAGFKKNFDTKPLADCFCEKILSRDVVLHKISNQVPEMLMFLNFNYTNTLQPYIEKCTNLIHSEIINIHGKLGDSFEKPIFGFGDEIDKRYSEFENENNNELFKHIKSFDYLKTSNYSDLMRFLSARQYQVDIYGHSCGLSDRTMLKEIFEHENCISIKIFYHQKNDTSNDYTEKTYEIYRHFENKGMMRKKIVPFNFSIAMPQPKLLFKKK